MLQRSISDELKDLELDLDKRRIRTAASRPLVTASGGLVRNLRAGTKIQKGRSPAVAQIALKMDKALAPPDVMACDAIEKKKAIHRAKSTAYKHAFKEAKAAGLDDIAAKTVARRAFAVEAAKYK